jgi:F-box protein 9
MDPAVSNPELESFREQWRAEVLARQAQQQQQQQQQVSPGPAAGPSRPAPVIAPPAAIRGKPPKHLQRQQLPKQSSSQDDNDEDYVPINHSFDEPARPEATSSTDSHNPTSSGNREPVTALEHFERAVEKEAAGNLGDSLRLYRQAFKVGRTS